MEIGKSLALKTFEFFGPIVNGDIGKIMAGKVTLNLIS
jgi:hypothetical protein